MSDQEIPEADAAEQAQPVTEPSGPVASPSDDPEAPEADALEQAQSVPVDPEEEAR
jgi:hypothetical protein